MRLSWALPAIAIITACAGAPPAPPSISPSDARSIIEHSLPRSLTDRRGWLDDIYAAFTALKVPPSRENVCAVVSVIRQESGFQIDPAIAGLGGIARREIDSRAERAHVPLSLVHGILSLKGSDGRTYRERLDRARTEKDLSDVYEDFIDSVPLGRTLFENRNPIRTRGPMQVNVIFAERFASANPYPYPVARSIPDELFSRRGSIYFGVAHLLDYPAPYEDYVYRFADYNAGQYASRNAAFQRAVTAASGIALDADGALLPREEITTAPGPTESALRTMSPRLRLSNAAIHSALEQAGHESFAHSSLYVRIFELADRAAGGTARATLPQIDLRGPKIKRHLTTAWYAEQVAQRFKSCLKAF